MKSVRKVLTALSAAVLGGNMVTAIGCFFRLMFYTNVPKHVETVLYVTLGIMLAYVIGFIVMADDNEDIEY